MNRRIAWWLWQTFVFSFQLNLDALTGLKNHWKIRGEQLACKIEDDIFGDQEVLQEALIICQHLLVEGKSLDPVFDMLKIYRPVVFGELQLKLLEQSPKRDLWRMPEAAEAKMQLIGREAGEFVETYLWYELGRIGNISNDEIAHIIATFFEAGKVPGFGDIEIHNSHVLPDTMLLRLRGNLRVLPGFTLGERYCPLYQFGHGDDYNDPAKYVHFPQALAIA